MHAVSCMGVVVLGPVWEDFSVKAAPARAGLAGARAARCWNVESLRMNGYMLTLGRWANSTRSEERRPRRGFRASYRIPKVDIALQDYFSPIGSLVLAAEMNGVDQDDDGDEDIACQHAVDARMV